MSFNIRYLKQSYIFSGSMELLIREIEISGTPLCDFVNISPAHNVSHQHVIIFFPE
jgi:hypothetical protein